MPLIEVTCEVCGKVRKRYLYEPAEHRFCSKKCHGKYISERQVGEGNAYWKGGKRRLVCKQCGQVFSAYLSDRLGLFCSKVCRDAGISTKKQVTCAYCGKSFYRRLTKLREKRNFCSLECSGKWFSENLRGPANIHFGKPLSIEQRLKRKGKNSGPNNYRWKGGVKSENMKIRNSLETKLWREAVFARDDFTCQKCSTRGGYLNAHHILSFATHPELRFDPDNGITLCRSCHLETMRRITLPEEKTETQALGCL